MPDSTPVYFSPFFKVILPGRPCNSQHQDRPGEIASLTDRFASRNIILSLRCLIGDADSPERAAGDWEGLGALATPLEVGFVGRWVMGLVPCHALGGGGFLKGTVESAARPRAWGPVCNAGPKGCNDGRAAGARGPSARRTRASHRGSM